MPSKYTDEIENSSCTRRAFSEEYVNDNLLNEQFNRENKNEVWVTDTTEVIYGEHTLHKARVHVVLDLYGRYVLSSNISDTETSSAVIDRFYNYNHELHGGKKAITLISGYGQEGVFASLNLYFK